MIRIPLPGIRLDRWRLRAHWEATMARRYVESLLGRALTDDQFHVFKRPIYDRYRSAA